MPWQAYLILVPPALLGLARIATWIARARGCQRNRRPGYINTTPPPKSGRREHA